MASVANRYGNKYVSYMLVKSAPRIIAVSAGAAIGAECLGNGFIDSMWNMLNRGVREGVERQWRRGFDSGSRRQTHTGPTGSLIPNTSLTIHFDSVLRVHVWVCRSNGLIFTGS